MAKGQRGPEDLMCSVGEDEIREVVTASASGEDKTYLLTPFQSFEGVVPNSLPSFAKQDAIEEYVASFGGDKTVQPYARAVAVAYAASVESNIAPLTHRILGEDAMSPKVSFVMNKETKEALTSVSAASVLIEQAFMKLRQDTDIISPLISDYDKSRLDDSAIVFVSAVETPLTWTLSDRTIGFERCFHSICGSLMKLSHVEEVADVTSRIVLSNFLGNSAVEFARQNQTKRSILNHRSSCFWSEMKPICSKTARLTTEFFEWLTHGGDMGFSEFVVEKASEIDEILSGERIMSLVELNREADKHNADLKKMFESFILGWCISRVEPIYSSLNNTSRDDIFKHMTDFSSVYDVRSYLVNFRLHEALESGELLSVTGEDTSVGEQANRMFNTLCAKMLAEGKVLDAQHVSSVATRIALIDHDLWSNDKNLRALIYLNDVMESAAVGAKTVAGIIACLNATDAIFGKKFFDPVLMVAVCLKSGNGASTLRFFADYALSNSRTVVYPPLWINWIAEGVFEPIETDMGIDPNLAIELMIEFSNDDREIVAKPNDKDGSFLDALSCLVDPHNC